MNYFKVFFLSLLIAGVASFSLFDLTHTNQLSLLANFLNILSPNSLIVNPMTILNNGYIGIGTTAPSAKLHIATDDFKIRGGMTFVGGEVGITGSVLTATSTDGLVEWLKPGLNVEDFRACIQLSDEGGSGCSSQFGRTQCTPFKSEGGGWSDWAFDADLSDPNCFRIKLETKTSSVCGTPITDSRDGQVYETVEIGSQCWLKDNLNIGTMIKSCVGGFLGVCASGGDVVNNQSNNGVIEKYCYNDNETSCNNNGGFYQWNEAMQYSASCNGKGEDEPECFIPVKGICPDGWHIPSHYEWVTMERELCSGGNCGKIFPFDTSSGGFHKDSGPTNTQVKSRLSVSLVGARDWNGKFDYYGQLSHYWTSLDYGPHAWWHDIHASLIGPLKQPDVSTSSNLDLTPAFLKSEGFNVRCVRD